MNRRVALPLLLTLGLALALAVSRMKGPPPEPPSSAGFSAVRARGILGELLREGQPHPVESPLNRVVRDRILARFEALGFETSVQKAYSCGGRRRKRCANVENIVAFPRGSAGPLVVLVAHYDSVAKGPGASDDGVGVAALLDIASIVRDDRRIGFLITDGEEAGLLGAEAFARDPRLMGRVGVVINVENRGTTGPSLMFETSRRNANLLPAIRAMRRPITGSLFPAVYERLPNDTDLSVFKRAGKQGVNLAAIDGVEHYHSAHDDLAHVDLRTLQHHGDNALAMARAFAARMPAPATHNAVFFDVFGFFVVSWPERWTLWMLLVSLIVLATRAERSGFMVVAILWHVLAFVTAWALPGAAYLLAFPAFAMAVGAWLPPEVRAPLAAGAAAIVCLPLVLMLHVALGTVGLVADAVLVVLILTTFLPDLVKTKQPAGRRAVSG